MKKSILAVAGLAAVAGVVAPMGAAFADNDPVTSFTDNLTVTVTETCTYGAADAPVAQGNNYTASGTAGALLELSADDDTPTTVTVTCNSQNGYKITPTFSALAGEESGQSIAYDDNAAAGSGTWTAYYSENGGAATAFTASDTAIERAASATANTYSFSYKVGLATNQAQDTYEGTALYALEAK